MNLEKIYDKIAPAILPVVLLGGWSIWAFIAGDNGAGVASLVVLGFLLLIFGCSGSDEWGSDY